MNYFKLNKNNKFLSYDIIFHIGAYKIGSSALKRYFLENKYEALKKFEEYENIINNITQKIK